MADIALDGIWLSDLPTGARGSVTQLEGWWDTPEPNLLDDGEPDPVQPWVPRIISIGGQVQADSHDQLHETGEFLTGMLRRRGVLTVAGHGPTMHTQVTRSARVRFTTVSDRLGLWSATLRAKDALKYGGWQAPVTMPNDVRTEGIFHRGNADALPIVEVTGAAPGGYRVSHEDNLWWEVATPLAAGQTDTIDFSAGRAWRDGVPIRDFARAQIIRIHPGPGQVMRVRPTTTGSVTGVVHVQDTWA